MRNIIITGAAGGIGQAAIHALRGADRCLIGVDVRPIPEYEGPGHFIRVQSDLANRKECEEIVTKVGAPISGLVHLAGLYREGDLENDLWNDVVGSNLQTAYDLTLAIIPKLESDCPARLIYASSASFRRGAPDALAYSIAKSGIVGLVRSLARRLGPLATVNAVAPGPIDTPMPAQMLLNRRAELESFIPLGRIGKAEEVADLIAFLYSDKASYISGQVFNIDGGLCPS